MPIAALSASFAAGQSLQAVALVGHTVLVPGNKLVAADGAGGPGAFSLPSAADDVTITVKDAAGATVRTIKLGAQSAGIARFAWDGKTDGGAAAKDGVYTYEAAANSGGTAVTAQLLMAGKVMGLTTGANGMQLDLGSLGNFDISQVIQLS